MSPLQRKTHVLAVSALAAAVLVTGCSEIQQVSDGVDKAQQCLKAAAVVTDTVQKITKLTDDPAAMEKALNDGAAKLGDVADKAANTTLKEAADGVAKNLRDLNVTDADSAVDATQKLATDSVRWVKQLTDACG
ncbi:hypothetical protein GCM10017673_06710 [Streptosporangium violaceochromogenes]|nr:hypothetical protein GCM10017673_06710 [Streptosporangium violaceochromogenes]